MLMDFSFYSDNMDLCSLFFSFVFIGLGGFLFLDLFVCIGLFFIKCGCFFGLWWDF